MLMGLRIFNKTKQASILNNSKDIQVSLILFISDKRTDIFNYRVVRYEKKDNQINNYLEWPRYHIRVASLANSRTSKDSAPTLK